MKFQNKTMQIPSSSEDETHGFCGGPAGVMVIINGEEKKQNMVKM